MTEAEEKLIDFLLHYGSASPMMQKMIDAVADERRAIANAHPYGYIAESMLVTQRKPEPYGCGNYPNYAADTWFQRRDVCDPLPSRSHGMCSWMRAGGTEGPIGNKSYGL